MAAFDPLVGEWTIEATHDEPGFSQRLEAKLSDDGATLAGAWQLSRDDATWADDLAITFTRATGAGPAAGLAPGSQDP